MSNKTEYECGTTGLRAFLCSLRSESPVLLPEFHCTAGCGGKLPRIVVHLPRALRAKPSAQQKAITASSISQPGARSKSFSRNSLSWRNAGRKLRPRHKLAPAARTLRLPARQWRQRGPGRSSWNCYLSPVSRLEDKAPQKMHNEAVEQ